MRVIDPGDIRAVLLMVIEDDHHAFAPIIRLDDLHHFIGAGRILDQVQYAFSIIYDETLIASLRLRSMIKYSPQRRIIDLKERSDCTDRGAVVYRI